MKSSVLTISLIALTSIASSDPKKFDITSRKMTDPLLKISTSKEEVSRNDLGACTKGKLLIPEKRGNTYVYKKILRKKDVISVHPDSISSPAYIDFSAITSKAKGELKVNANNHPKGNFIIKIKKDGKTIKKEFLSKGRWRSFSIPFNNNKVVVEVTADTKKLCYEYGFISYSISK